MLNALDIYVKVVVLLCRHFSDSFKPVSLISSTDLSLIMLQQSGKLHYANSTIPILQMCKVRGEVIALPPAKGTGR